MSPDFTAVRALFEKVRLLGPAEREAVLHKDCAHDPDLRAEVESLLAHVESSSLDAGPVSRGQLDRVLQEVSSTQAPLPRMLDKYELHSVLGEGGMGTVYRAQQTNPDREVALKIVRPSAASPTLLARLRREARLLGRLQHPGIAQIFEAGSVGEGPDLQPFFVMELVNGDPLDEFVNKHALSLEAKLWLIVDICEAIHHAHQKGVVHRDLKPGNILVVPHRPESSSDETAGSTTEVGRATRAGQPKILDFSIARDTEEALRTTTVQTRAGQWIGTLPYMSPEQVSSQKIDGRSDVYSLGVLMYEILAGRHPYDLSGKSIPEAAQDIREKEPPRLGQLERRCRGDIETIVACALEKDPLRRYPSALALGDDIRRTIHHEPIEARPPTRVYQLQKFARRHVGLMAGVTVALVAVISGLIGMTLLTLRARTAEAEARLLAEQESLQRTQAVQAREEAERREQISGAIHEFLDRMLVAPDPWQSSQEGARETRVQEVLDRAGLELETFQGLPDVEAAVRLTLGRTYRNLGDFPQAEKHLRRSWEIRAQELGEEHPDTLASRRELVWWMIRAARVEDSVAAARSSFEEHRKALGEEHPSTLDAARAFVEALCENRELTEAEQVARSTAATAQAALSKDDMALVHGSMSLSSVLIRAGKLTEAQSVVESLIEQSSTVRGRDHPFTMSARSHLCLILYQQRRLQDHESLARELLEDQTRVLGEEDYATLITMDGLIKALTDQGKYREAMALRKDQIRLARENLGEDHSLTLNSMSAHSVCLNLAGHPQQAEKWARDSIAGRQRVYPEGHPEILSAQNSLANLFFRRGRFEEAEILLTEIVEHARQSLAENPWRRAQYESALGRCLTRLGHFEDAEDSLLTSLDSMQEVAGDDHPFVRETQDFLDEMYRLWDESLADG